MYVFTIGNDTWIAIYPYELTINQEDVIPSINESPEDWGEGTLNFGDPTLFLWELISLAAIVTSIMVARAKRQNLPVTSQ